MPFGWVCGSFLGLSVFAWVLLRGVSLGFFWGSWVFLLWVEGVLLGVFGVGLGAF
jgi:hypothetical protein